MLAEMHTLPTEFFAKSIVVREGLRDEGPELERMIKLCKVAEFVDDNVVGQMRRKERDTVIEVKILFA